MISRRHIPTLALATFSLVLTATTTARANGRFPATSQLVAAPTDPRSLVLRSTFGVLFSKDGGTTWDWICEKAVGYGGVEDPSIAVTKNLTVLAGTYEGLAVSPDFGCGWSFAGGAGLAGAAAIDVAMRRDDPSSGVVLVTENLKGGGDALYDNRVFATSDDGKTFRQIGTALDSHVITETIEVAGGRLYASAILPTGEDAGTSASTSFTGALYVSDDQGATWDYRNIPLDPAIERAPFIAAVDPTNPDRVYVRSSGPGTSRLFVTDDAGKSFRAVYTGSPMLGFALSPDGSQVLLGGVDGLFVASAQDLSFQKRSSIQVQCLAFAGPTLFACSSETSGFILGASSDMGATFQAKLHLNGIRGPLACAPGESATQCAADWPALNEQLGGTNDAGASDAGAPSGNVSSRGGCTCDVTRGAGGLASVVIALGLAGLALLRRRR